MSKIYNSYYYKKYVGEKLVINLLNLTLVKSLNFTGTVINENV